MDLSYGPACEAIREEARTFNKANPLGELIWARFKRIDLNRQILGSLEQHRENAVRLQGLVT